MNRPVSNWQSDHLSYSYGGTIMCDICQAVYAPARTHTYLLQAPPIALESAFMSMCHFCFRCRRPSCPNCWDDVHGICGQCAEETHLPFRLETAPLDGVPFIPDQQPTYKSAYTTPSSFLTSVQPGRFQALLSIENIATRPDRPSSPRAPEDIDAIRTRPTARPKKLPDIDTIKTRPQRTKPRRRSAMRVFWTIVLVVFIVFVLLVVAAAWSAEVNTFILATIHMDIRAEIAHIWQSLLHLF